MKPSRAIAAGLIAAVLSGCGLFQRPEPVAPVCPAPEPKQCPEPTVIETIVEVPASFPIMATTAGKLHLPIIGGVEWVTVEPAGLSLEARIDTGATTTSIHAENIQRVEKEGDSYIRFTLLDENSGEVFPMELPLRRKVLIKQHLGEAERRYVVPMWLTLGYLRARVDVTLSDREDFEYPLLVGRNFLVDAAIVDVSRQHTQIQTD